MSKPFICNLTQAAVMPEPCDVSCWLTPVIRKEDIIKPDCNHAYITDENKFFVMGNDGELVEVNKDTEWGELVGDIENQTDLINLLDLKANITDLDLYQLVSEKVNLEDFTDENQYPTAKSVYDYIQSVLESITGGLKIPIQIDLESELPDIDTLENGDYFFIQNMDVTVPEHTGRAWVNTIDDVKQFFTVYDQYQSMDGVSIVQNQTGTWEVSTDWLNRNIQALSYKKDSLICVHENWEIEDYTTSIRFISNENWSLPPDAYSNQYTSHIIIMKDYKNQYFDIKKGDMYGGAEISINEGTTYCQINRLSSVREGNIFESEGTADFIKDEILITITDDMFVRYSSSIDFGFKAINDYIIPKASEDFESGYNVKVLYLGDNEIRNSGGAVITPGDIWNGDIQFGTGRTDVRIITQNREKISNIFGNYKTFYSGTFSQIIEEPRIGNFVDFIYEYSFSNIPIKTFDDIINISLEAPIIVTGYGMHDGSYQMILQYLKSQDMGNGYYRVYFTGIGKDFYNTQVMINTSSDLMMDEPIFNFKEYEIIVK